MITHIHIHCRQTHTRLFCIPCASVAIARQIALSHDQRQNLCIVESPELTAAYTDGALLFCSSDPQEIQQHLRRLKLHPDHVPISDSAKPPRSFAPKSRGSTANTARSCNA